MDSSDLDFQDTNHDDLSTGLSPWGSQQGLSVAAPERGPLKESIKTDIAIVGAGITGALAAEHLTSLGHKVIVLDREQPGLGSTRASTAMLQWETDSSLVELTGLYGFETAADVYRRSHAAVAGLMELVATHQIPCAFHPRPTLYLAAGQVGEKELREELALRHKAGLPGDLLTPTARCLGISVSTARQRSCRPDRPRPTRCCSPGRCCGSRPAAAPGSSMQTRCISMTKAGVSS